MKRKVFFFSSLSILLTITFILGLILSLKSLKIWYYQNLLEFNQPVSQIAKIFKGDFLPTPQKYYSPLSSAPKEKILYFLYINEMISKINFLSEDASKKNMNSHLEQNKLILAQLTDAKMIDSDNAYYNYCRAYIYATEALVLKNHSIEEKEKHNKQKQQVKKFQSITNFNFNYKEDYRYKLINEKKLNMAIEEYKIGLTKKYYRNDQFTYVENTIAKYNFSINNFYDYINISILRTEPLLPSLGFLRENIRVINFYAKLKYTQGNTKEAENILKSINILLKQRLKDKRSIIDGLVDLIIISLKSKTQVKLYHNLNNKKKEQEFLKEFKKICAIKNDLGLNELKLNELNNIMQKHSAVLTKLIIPTLKVNLSNKELIEKLQPERIIGAKLIEKIMINVIFMLFCFLSLILFITYLIQYKIRDLSCRIIVPNLKELLYIIIGVFILPIGIYLITTNYELIYNKSSFSYHYCFENKFQALLFLTTLIYPTFSIVKIIVRRYCRNHNIEYPRKLSFISIFNYLFYAIVLIFSNAFVWKFLHNPANPNNEACNASQILYLNTVIKNQPTIILTIISVVVFMLIILISDLIFFIHNKNNKYRQLLFCNYLFYVGLFSLLITGMVYSVASEIENYYFNKDKIIFLKDKNNAFTIIESKQVEYLDEQIKKTLK